MIGGMPKGEFFYKSMEVHCPSSAHVTSSSPPPPRSFDVAQCLFTSASGLTAHSHTGHLLNPRAQPGQQPHCVTLTLEILYVSGFPYSGVCVAKVPRHAAAAAVEQTIYCL